MSGDTPADSLCRCKHPKDEHFYPWDSEPEDGMMCCDVDCPCGAYEPDVSDTPEPPVSGLAGSDDFPVGQGGGHVDAAPATPEGGELEDLLARAGDHDHSLAQALSAASNTAGGGLGYISKRTASQCRELILDLASALRSQRGQADNYHAAWLTTRRGLLDERGQRERLERELAEARDTREVLARFTTSGGRLALGDGWSIMGGVVAARPGTEVLVVRAAQEDPDGQ